jgi:hypothetical protein
LALEGEEPRHYKPYYDADSGSKEELVALCDVCQSMHMVMSLGKGFPPGNFISSELNPAELICTCKGYKVSSNCSHTIAVTALFITDAQCVSGWKSWTTRTMRTTRALRPIGHDDLQPRARTPPLPIGRC